MLSISSKKFASKKRNSLCRIKILRVKISRFEHFKECYILQRKLRSLTLEESGKYIIQGRHVLKFFNNLMALQKKKKKGRAKSDYIHRDFL